ncbi:hypothetical protein CGRA01v4_04906 [Colletotrichum graminicola]|uniref:Apple domain-containing protein n=1 Tax=Colletotrichum graminicola (strain M1.001 / M2 / FGSC 10212) TaxID=645133 RepID=E3QEC4_COLGM|nr:uncharacterized protein GLRG_04374 [Colletotrichum graminicola M1.001]EFQ29230.1 hypothetical protein GLRG_04374 [Colletotrichum graminicola M1.001]WDK13626.1 hypothetical protein CGRA01v4_04906 [Colletotrichum graminicola]
MRYARLLGAILLYSRRAVARVIQGRNFQPDPQLGEWTHPVAARGRSGPHFNGTVNATSSAGTGTAGAPSSSAFSLPYNITSIHAPGCPQSVTTSTTTVDVTFYITATTSYGGNLTSFRSTSTGTPPSSLSSQIFANSTSSRPAWNESSSSFRLSTGYTLPVNSSHASTTISFTTVSETPCPDNTTSLPYHYSSSFLGTGGSTSTVTSVAVWYNTTSAVPSQTTEPCSDDPSTTTHLNPTSAAFNTQLNSTAPWPTRASTSTAQETPCDNETSGSNVTATHTTATSSDSHVNSTTTSMVTPVLSKTSSIAYSTYNTTTMKSVYSSSFPVPTESCVIDTSMVPVTIAPLTSVPTSTIIPTKTVCQEDAPTGKPKPGNNHCGVHGLPVGNYFLARFVENAPGVPVTLEGCYQFCASVMDATNGCKAYRFYPERGLNVQRCDLYGSSVAYALDSIDNDHPDIWFDLNCGSPSDERWAHLPGMTRLRELGLLG